MFEIGGTLLAIECCLEAGPQSCISCLLQHEKGSLASKWQRSCSREGWSQGVAGQEDRLPWADAHRSWAAGAQPFVLAMKAAGKRQKGKALIGKKGIAE